MSVQGCLTETRRVIRMQGKSYRTEQCYLQWIKRFLEFFQGRRERPGKEQAVSEFLSHLAVQRRCAVQTQKQALNAIVFFYK